MEGEGPSFDRLKGLKSTVEKARKVATSSEGSGNMVLCLHSILGNKRDNTQYCWEGVSEINSSTSCGPRDDGSIHFWCEERERKGLERWSGCLPLEYRERRATNLISGPPERGSAVTLLSSPAISPFRTTMLGLGEEGEEKKKRGEECKRERKNATRAKWNSHLSRRFSLAVFALARLL